MVRKRKHERMWEWAATFETASDALAEAAAVTARTDEAVAAWRHAREVVVDVRSRLPNEAPWLSPEEMAERDLTLAQAEALCNESIAKLKADSPYVVEPEP